MAKRHLPSGVTFPRIRVCPLAAVFHDFNKPSSLISYLLIGVLSEVQDDSISKSASAEGIQMREGAAWPENIGSTGTLLFHDNGVISPVASSKRNPPTVPSQK